MQEIISSITSLPEEILYLIMKILDGRGLYLFSMTCQSVYYMIEKNEELWENCYALGLPEIHRGLLQPPKTNYWAFSEPKSRRFLYLCMGAHKDIYFNEIDSILEVMQNNSSRSGPLLMGCYVMRRLTYTPPAGCKEEYKNQIIQNRLYFGENGAIELLLKLLEDSFNSVDLMAAVLCALNNICCTGINCHRMIKEGGVHAVLQVMKKYSSEISVLDYGSAVLANISREDKGPWIDFIIAEGGASLAKKLLETNATSPPSNDSIISGLNLFALLAKNNAQFRKSYGGIILPLIKDLLHKEERDLVISCSRALTEFFKCSGIHLLVEELDLISVLLYRLENETDSSLAFFIITALNSLFWKKTVNGKDSFSRYVTIMVDKLKKGSGKKEELPVAITLGNIAHQDENNLKFIKSFQVSKILSEVIKQSSPSKYNHILHLFQD